MRATVLLILALLPGLLLGACGEADSDERIRLATTTSTDNSGLLKAILPAFEATHGARVDVIAVGTGQALALGRRGEADLVLAHARSREDAFIEAGHGLDRRDVMWNDFVLVGPPEDPAQVKGMRDAGAALRKIADARATFISRGDDSGTHIRERTLWEKAGGHRPWEGYLSAGQGMGPCLTIAYEKKAYTLTDRGTLLAHPGRLDLHILVQGDLALRNPYGAMLVNPSHHPHANAKGARALLDYLTSAKGQEAIGAFRVDGKILFHPHQAR